MKPHKPTSVASPRFISIADAAQRVGVSQKFIETAIVATDNRLISFKVGRRRLIDIDELDAWVLAQRG